MDSAAIAATMIRSLGEARQLTSPFRHWRPRRMLSDEAARDLADLPLALPAGLDLSAGRREANNDTRMFFDPASQGRVPAMRALAEAMQAPEMVVAWQTLCGIDLAGTFLRIEYCCDGDGFWLEPHTDIGAKRITVLIYLSRGPEAEAWGTDVYGAGHALVESVPAEFNGGMVFVPAADTWHGFHQRPINGLRRSLMLNYVGPEWRSRHELCFPAQPV
jgi:hypothetical protein